MNLSDYLALFPGAAREKPRYMALAEAVLRQAADMIPLVQALCSAFSVDAAEGVQLDRQAAALGVFRADLGEGVTDEAFRQYLLAKLALWRWDGTNGGLPDVLAAVLPGVTVTDNMNGTVSVSPAGTDRNLLPVPAGTGISE